jgi:YHS domain-containing protein
MKFVLAAFLVTLAACGGSPTPKPVEPTTAPSAEKTLVLVDDKGVGLGGHDPTSYPKGAPVAGSAEHASSHGGATYHFASAEDKASFEADKATFIPGFGGYCAFAAAQNRLSPADPTVFLVHEGQLLVFTNEDFKTQFAADPAGNKAKAEANWPGLVAKHGR